MQDEVNEKTIALYIKTGKLTAQTLQKAMKAILSKGKKQLAKPPQGKQSLKQLMKQNAGVSNIEITKDNIYKTGSRQGLIVAMNAALPFMDGEMRGFAARTLSKVEAMTEAEFAGLPIYAADEV